MKKHWVFSDAERAALDFALAASMVPNVMTDEIADRLREHWNAGEIAEITALYHYLPILTA